MPRFLVCSIKRLILRCIEVFQCFYSCNICRLTKSGKMFYFVNPGFKFFTRYIMKNSIKRHFLSKAYRCEEAWANRLKNPVFQKVNLDNLYYELDVNFQKNRRISVLDIDILFNSIQGSGFKNELNDVLLRIRLCPECVILPERATHAAIRWYMEHAPTDELFNTLSDRLNYGLFPDYYLTNLMMDKYLKEKDARSAVKVAVLQMLQEDLENPIMKALALYSCYYYLESPDIWETYKEPEPDPDEEVKKIRVAYLRNPYFDDHFDITDTNHLVGKTLWMFGYSVDGIMGASSQLVGLVLHEKFEKCAEFLEEAIQKKVNLHADAVAKAKEYCLKKPKQNQGENEGGEEKTEGDVNAKAEEVNEWKSKVLELLEKVNEKNLLKNSLLSDSAEMVRKMVKENEGADIRHQCEIYKQWEKDREDNIKSEIDRAELLKIQLEIEKTKSALKMEEEKLFFFDKEDEINLVIKEKEQEMAGVFYYKERKKKSKDASSDDYIPPEVQKKF